MEKKDKEMKWPVEKHRKEKRNLRQKTHSEEKEKLNKVVHRDLSFKLCLSQRKSQANTKQSYLKAAIFF